MDIVIVNHHRRLCKNVDEIIPSRKKSNLFFLIFNFFSFSRTPSPRSATSRSRSRSSIEGSKSPVARTNPNNNHRSPSPPHHSSSSSSKRRRHKGSDADNGRHICAICSCDVEGAKRLYGVLDNCDHILYVLKLIFIKKKQTCFCSCYECIVSWKRSKYSNAESER